MKRRNGGSACSGTGSGRISSPYRPSPFSKGLIFIAHTTLFGKGVSIKRRIFESLKVKRAGGWRLRVGRSSGLSRGRTALRSPRAPTTERHPLFVDDNSSVWLKLAVTVLLAADGSVLSVKIGCSFSVDWRLTNRPLHNKLI
ncbi:hypothetical protein F2P81_013244 [Scophthalmus maximus]|uniref:Uncharacterized protein n=1 Tax=Scophthalmus maximus TaxID=52904 RepID=A0A6A4SJT5_SCOMX|nr:hypothetical protein F2P81_013244 [Scophthalmus maximus]